MGNLKILTLEGWMSKTKTGKAEEMRERTLSKYKEIPPVFNRTGRYLKDGVAWMEVDDGRAFTHPSMEDVFERDLEEHEMRTVSKEEQDAILVLSQSERFGSQKLSHDACVIRSIRSEKAGRILHLRFMKHLRTLKESKDNGS